MGGDEFVARTKLGKTRMESFGGWRISRVNLHCIPNFGSLTDVFASINIFLLICVLFSPILLVYGFPEPQTNRCCRSYFYVLSALLIVFMIAYLARGDNYYSGFVVNSL